MTAFLTLIESQEEKSRFCAFYEKYIGMVLWIAGGKLNNNSFLAEECAQETFLYFAKHFSKVGDIYSPQTKAFVGVVATACAIRIFRKEIEKTSVIYEKAVSEYECEPNDLDSFDHLELKTAVSTLDDESRNFIYMKYFFGLKNKEISQITGDSEYLVRKKLASAIAAVKRNLKED